MKGMLRGPAKYPLIISLVIIILFALGWWLMSGKYIPVLEPSGVIADSEKNILIIAVILMAVIVVPMFALLAIFAWKYREGNKNQKYAPEWSENRKLEIAWWGIPIIIIGILGVITWFTSHSLDPYRAIASSNKTIEVQVVALQWKWLFIYPDYGVASVNDLTIPVNTPVHFTLSADAPMSAFWIPALGSQIYSMNSMSSQLNLLANNTGTYKGYNTNINGKGYADMVFDASVVSNDSFMNWRMSLGSSDNLLTADVYKKLAEPSISSVVHYKLMDRNLYDKIVMSQMNGTGIESTDSTNGTNMSAMEGM